LTAKIPERTFIGAIGDESEGTKGPEAIRNDIDEIICMFNPAGEHADGSPGGIDGLNMKEKTVTNRELADDAVTDDVIGDRTFDENIADEYSKTGTLTQHLSWLWKYIKSITGADPFAAVADTIANMKSLLTGVINALATHKTSADHDGRYYTETEIDEMEITAERVTAEPVATDSGSTVQAILAWLKDQIYNVVLDQVPDDSINNAKLGTDVKVGSLAELTTAIKTSVVAAMNSIVSVVSGISTDLDTHKAENATEEKLGHVKVKTKSDGTLIIPVNVEDGNQYTIVLNNDEHLAKVAESDSYGGNIYGLTMDDAYIYIGGATTQKVYKLNKSNLAKVAESDSYGNAIYCLAVDDTHIYIGGAVTQKVYKLNKSDLANVAESDSYGATIYGLAMDDAYIYIGGAITQKVYKLNKSDLAKVAESDSYGGAIYGLATDATHIYIGGAITQKVYKLNKSDLAKVAESDSYGGAIYGLATDATHIYIGGDTTQKVYKLNKSNLAKVAESDSYGGNIRGLAVDDTHIYMGEATTQKVYKIFNKATMSVFGLYRRE
jgi:hypothetical protein